MKTVNIGIVGATGLIGSTMLKVMEENNIKVDKLKLFASLKSVGKEVKYLNKKYKIEKISENSFSDLDFVLFSAGAEISRKYALIASKNAFVIDNSSFYRMNQECALIVPEINMDDYKNKSKIIANPNCSTLCAILALSALKKEFKILSIHYNTYQSVSGSGQKGINEYLNVLKGMKNDYYPYNISQTCIPHIDSFLLNSYTKEEMKMINETRKILHDDTLKISATCVRVPVLYCHGVSVSVELDRDFDINEIKKIFLNQEGLILYDDIKKNIYPNSIIAKDNNYVYIGRIRKDLARENSLLFYVVSDNTRRGAAYNAVKIMLNLIKLLK